MIAYFNGQWVEKERIAISPDDRGFLFADGVYEVMRSYHGRFFAMETHLDRLKNGLKELHIEGVDLSVIRVMANQLIRENQLNEGDAIVYIQITRGCAPRSHPFPPAGTPPTIYAFAKRFASYDDLQSHGAKAILVPDQRWSRCDIKSTALVANVLAS